MQRTIRPDHQIFIDQFLHQMADRHRPILIRIEIAVEQLEENPLRPLVISRVRRIDFAIPIIAQPEHLNLAAEVFDILLRGDGRMNIVLHRVLLGGQTKRIPPHRMQHVVPLHPPKSRDDVCGGVPLRMPDMQPRAARVGEHVQNVRLGHPAGIGRIKGGESLVRQPVVLPLFFDRGEVIAHR